MTDEFPALTIWQQIGFILATPGYNDGVPFLDESDMAEIARLLDEYKAERDAERDAIQEQADALLVELATTITDYQDRLAGAFSDTGELRNELADCRDMLQDWQVAAGMRRDERDELRAWIIEADSAFNRDGKPAASVDECTGLVRMCHEGAAALAEVADLREQLAKLRELIEQHMGSAWLDAQVKAICQ
jgi:chromosome segregation ATPase